ncbi:hypothetical protein ASZ90_018120 [hydrocarbon metagenome]|uniref:Uncharacterized protein n=1 Tax=hydrocarbon metagenome TaxID=938273 RepID=A0A0W8E779_9ZZZZ
MASLINKTHLFTSYTTLKRALTWAKIGRRDSLETPKDYLYGTRR